MSNCLCEAIASGVLRIAQNSMLKPHSGLSQPLTVESEPLAVDAE
jgi:hypothetical protein